MSSPNSSPSVKLPTEKEPSPPPLPGYTRSGLRFFPPGVRCRSVAQMRRIRGCTGGVKISSDYDDGEPVKVGQGYGSGVSSTEKAKEVVPEGSTGLLCGSKRLRFEPPSPVDCSSSEDDFFMRFY
ncbi:unnamed protein product [Amaranthus hypochondriacus]